MAQPPLFPYVMASTSTFPSSIVTENQLPFPYCAARMSSWSSSPDAGHVDQLWTRKYINQRLAVISGQTVE